MGLESGAEGRKFKFPDRRQQISNRGDYSVCLSVSLPHDQKYDQEILTDEQPQDYFFEMRFIYRLQ